jgi:hypothetical protein
LIGLVHRERCFDQLRITSLADEAREADQVTVGMDVVFVGFAQRADAVL